MAINLQMKQIYADKNGKPQRTQRRTGLPAFSFHSVISVSSVASQSGFVELSVAVCDPAL